MTLTRTTTRRHRTTATLSCVAMLGLLAACGSGDDDDGTGVASLGTVAPDDGADTNSADDNTGDDAGDGDDATDGTSEGETDPQEAMLEYTECMRDHGIDMPDPQFSEDGGSFAVVGGPGSEDEGADDFNPDSPEYQAAEAECGPILEDAVGQIEVDPEQEAEMREQMLEFAACMREHGIDMPDPVFDSNGRVEVQIGSEEGEAPMDQEAMEDAQEACMEETGGGGPIFGGGPSEEEG
jgi:hypothetical protein